MDVRGKNYIAAMMALLSKMTAPVSYSTKWNGIGPKATYPNHTTNAARPHQGKQECARRVRQGLALRE